MAEVVCIYDIILVKGGHLRSRSSFSAWPLGTKTVEGRTRFVVVRTDAMTRKFLGDTGPHHKTVQSRYRLIAARWPGCRPITATSRVDTTDIEETTARNPWQYWVSGSYYCQRCHSDGPDRRDGSCEGHSWISFSVLELLLTDPHMETSKVPNWAHHSSIYLHRTVMMVLRRRVASGNRKDV